MKYQGKSFMILFLVAVLMIAMTATTFAAPRVTVMIAAAASLQNTFEKGLIPEFQRQNPAIAIEGTYDSSGKLQMQIESGLQADIFFSAAPKQMNDLKSKGLIESSSNLLENKIVLIKTKGMTTNVTGFENITNADTIAIGDPGSVPAGQYAREVFTSIGNWDAVLAKASLGTNVTEVLSWVAQGSADVGVVYATDAASNGNVTIITQAPAWTLKQPVLYPIGTLTSSPHKTEAQAFIDFLKSDTAKSIFESYGFSIIR
ncbi:MAG: molybdate ABC transporter substrate-binding protein [Sporomusaceae bacterium]|jgi:molybdate transport system substrate-binding protein|nr:molybdate ABC transporter substrate-binding protein [Sporomusaceae bacterium]